MSCDKTTIVDRVRAQIDRLLGWREAIRIRKFGDQQQQQHTTLSRDDKKTTIRTYLHRRFPDLDHVVWFPTPKQLTDTSRGRKRIGAKKKRSSPTK